MYGVGAEIVWIMHAIGVGVVWIMNGMLWMHHGLCMELVFVMCAIVLVLYELSGGV